MVIGHNFFQHGRGPHQPAALRDEVGLRHIEELEVRGASPEAGTLLVCIADPVVDGFGIPRLEPDGLGNALAHELTGSRCTDHVDLVVHGRSNGRMVERRAKLLGIAWIGVDEHNQQLAGHAASPVDARTNASVPTSPSKVSQRAISSVRRDANSGAQSSLSVRVLVRQSMRCVEEGKAAHTSASDVTLPRSTISGRRNALAMAEATSVTSTV